MDRVGQGKVSHGWDVSSGGLGELESCTYLASGIADWEEQVMISPKPHPKDRFRVQAVSGELVPGSTVRERGSKIGKV